MVGRTLTDVFSPDGRAIVTSSQEMNPSNSIIEDDVWIPTVCNMCYYGCGIKVHRVNGAVVGIEGDPRNPLNAGKICAKGKSGILSLYNPNRVKSPMIRTNPEKGIGVDPKWEEITWEEALDIIAARLRKIREDDPRKLVITTFDIPPWQWRLMAFTTAFGTPNLYSGTPHYYCGNGTHTIDFLTLGTFWAGPDLANCNYCILWGSQAGFMTSTHETLEMAEARERGMHLVVIDPV